MSSFLSVAVLANVPNWVGPGWTSQAFAVPVKSAFRPTCHVRFEHDKLSANVHAGVLTLHHGEHLNSADPEVLQALSDVPLNEGGKVDGRIVRRAINRWFQEEANPDAPATVEAFARAAAQMTNEQIFDLFEEGISQALRDEIYSLSDPSSPEPFRSAVEAMGDKFGLPRLTEF
jgi:hypothetical protein